MAIERPRQHVRLHRHVTPEEPTSWYGILGQVLAWGVAIILFGLSAVLVVVPRIAGATPYTILTSSMVPQMPPGTVIVTTPAPFGGIRKGDVLTYQVESGEAIAITHRVIAMNIEATGTPRFPQAQTRSPSRSSSTRA